MLASRYSHSGFTQLFLYSCHAAGCHYFQFPKFWERIPQRASMPEWSKGAHLRCADFGRVGSNPTLRTCERFSSISFCFFLLCFSFLFSHSPPFNNYRMSGLYSRRPAYSPPRRLIILVRPPVMLLIMLQAAVLSLSGCANNFSLNLASAQPSSNQAYHNKSMQSWGGSVISISITCFS